MSLLSNFIPVNECQNIYSNMTSSKHSIPIVQKRIDNYTQLYPPLDYSFHNAEKIEGLN
jgi:hypothetical protein